MALRSGLKMKNFYEEKLKTRFTGQKSLTRDELFDFFSAFEPDLKEGTFGWRIYDLKQKNVLKTIGKGIYSLTDKAEFIPSIGKFARKVVKHLNSSFSELDYCLWETSALNEFSNLQTVSNLIVLEVEKELLTSVFDYLQNNHINDVYLQPDEKEMERYIIRKENPVILKVFLSRSPVQKIVENKLVLAVPFLEKILVDLYCDREIFYFYAGRELRNIFKNALERYNVDFSRLLNYAKRRGKGPELKEFIEEKINYSLAAIIK